jgi:hypothetical protein
MKESAIPQHAVDDPKPKPLRAVRVWLSDGSRVGRPPTVFGQEERGGAR